MWKLGKFTLIIFSQKFRESNIFSKWLKSSFQEIFLLVTGESEFLVFPHCVQHKKYECKYFCRFFGNIGRDFFFLGGERQYFFLRLLCARKKTDRKMHFINYYNNCIFPQVFYLNNKSSLNFLATCSKYVLFNIDLWKNHPNLLDFFAKAIFSQTLKVFLTERVRQICGGHS